jgi:hypothetical protein
MYLSRNLTGYSFLLILMLLLTEVSYGQNDATKTQRVIPGKEYEAGWLHRVFFGDHWRELWTTPIDVSVLDIDNFDGGLEPLKKGGGEQTKSLRLKSKSGKEYKFRSVNKDPSRALPPELWETLVSDVAQDQTSSSHPMAAIIASSLLNTLGILQAEPALFIMPDSKSLGEFREEFGGMLGTLEIHPDEYKDEEYNFAGADKIAGTEKLIERLRKHSNEFVHSSEYLKARLTDIFLGDWDRHINQWRWAMFTSDKRKFWHPIPRDRDQAFVRFDGVFPIISTMAITQLEHFNENYPDIEGLTWSGRHTDRRFLPQLTKAEWDSVTGFVQNTLSDSAIEYAVRRIPPAMYDRQGEELISILKIRRDKLNLISDDFYYQIIKYVNIHFTDEDEYVEVNRLNDSEVEVKAFGLNKHKLSEDAPFYKRIFNTDETSEIRIILNGGDDRVVVKGEVNESIKIFVSGDKGKDTLIDNSLVKGFLFPEKKTVFLDSGGKTVIKTGSSTSVKKEKYFYKDEVVAPRDWGHDWRFAPWFNLNPDDGLFIGGGGILYEFGFRRRPYVYRMELTGGYAAYAKRFRLRYTAGFNPYTPGIRYLLEAKTSGLEVLNFFGFGNNTKKSISSNDDYYKVKQQQIYLSPSMEFIIDSRNTFTLSSRLNFSYTYEGDLLFELNPYGSANMLLLNTNTLYVYDSRNNKDFPVEGFYFSTFAGYFPSIKKDQTPFYKLKSEGRVYISSSSFRLSSIALKLGGEKIWGRFPFFEAAFLGGENSLRGYDRNRFAGNASLYSSTELRLFLTDFKFLVPVYAGLTALADAGRVFYNGENSGGIKTSFGGGIWMSFIKPEYLLSFYAARSPEDTGLYLSFGFHY